MKRQQQRYSISTRKNYECGLTEVRVDEIVSRLEQSPTHLTAGPKIVHRIHPPDEGNDIDLDARFPQALDLFGNEHTRSWLFGLRPATGNEKNLQRDSFT
jgi:hypothetical protein